MTAVVICTLIRSLYWHKAEQGYRIDGRAKREWIAQIFGISLRTVTDARRQLIELGWITPIDDPQWMLNRYGAHDLINIEWFATPAKESSGGVADDDCQGQPASPRGDFRGESASPDLTDFSSSNEEELKTRRPTRRRSASSRADQPGASLRSALGSRKKNKRRTSGSSWGAGGEGGPNIRDIQTRDLSDTGRLLELLRQAVEIGIAKAGEGGRLDFVALAERALARAEKPAAMFFWLLSRDKTVFITQADEDEAARRIKTHLYGDPRKRDGGEERWGGGADGCSDAARETPGPPELTDDEKIVGACIKVARDRRIEDPFHVAQRVYGWSAEKWREASASYEEKQWERWKNPLRP